MGRLRLGAVAPLIPQRVRTRHCRSWSIGYFVKPCSKPYSSLSRSGLIGCPVKSCWRPFRTILPNSASGGQRGDLEELAEELAKGLAEELAKGLAGGVIPRRV